MQLIKHKVVYHVSQPPLCALLAQVDIFLRKQARDFIEADEEAVSSRIWQALVL